MEWTPPEASPLGERINALWQRGLRFVTRAAIAFALSAAAAIAVGAAVTDNAFAQILVTLLAALAFWVPFLVLVVRVDRWRARRGARRSAAPAAHAGPPVTAPASRDDEIWRRLFAVAPREAQRLTAVRRSLERSRLALGGAELDPDAHDLCILIDRRLPDLIHHELEILPPDDRNRRQKVGELIDLVEQFARHCSRSNARPGVDAAFEAEVLRRRFEARLTDF